MSKKLFDYVIGNPPYNADFSSYGDNDTYATPVYNLFLDEAYKVGDKVEMIHPARFLFNAGSTPKAWNEKMLNDEHLKILKFEQDSSKVFTNTDIKGGIAVSYRNESASFAKILTYTSFPELNSILHKVIDRNDFESLMNNIYIQNRFDLEKLQLDYPELFIPKMDANGKEFYVIGSKGKDKRLEKNIFSKASQVFTDSKNDETDIKILGILNGKRTWKYIPEKYIDKEHENINLYKVLLPTSNGSGAIGEVLSTPLIGEPLIGFTRSFISIGAYKTQEEAESCLKYVKSKFMRTCLGILKVTQDNNKDTWKYVPLQDFTSQSDIDWSKSISEIDQQLYKKYGLNEAEINFIETHVKEMN